MSGIVGLYHSNSLPVDRAVLVRMLDILSHRGPDGSGVWCEGSVGLGHRMLWTTPESLLEQQPLANQSGNLVLTADARIDNRDELITVLRLNGHSSEKITDSQLILAAYEKWGECCPEKLLGDFAFVIWDGYKQVLFCARDHFGVKPFYYYHHSAQNFVFASEIKALFCLPDVPRRLNEVRVAEYLLTIFEDKEITFYQDIFRLPPGYILTISQNEIKSWPYWSLDPSRELRLSSDEEYAKAFRELFIEAVRCRLRSAFPVGSTLSGGLDSSSVTCVARDLLACNGSSPLYTFSTIYDKVPECDERPFINAVLAQGNFAPRYVLADPLSPLADFDRVLWHQDEAVYAPNLSVYWGLCRAVQQQGVRVLLDGLDGDTTVSHGIAYLDELACTGQWAPLMIEVIRCAKHLNQSPWSALCHYVGLYGLKPLAPTFIRRAWRKLHRYNQSARNGNTIINRSLAQRIVLSEHIQALQESWLVRPQTEKDDHFRSLTWGVIPFMLEVVDRTAAAFSIETNHPFFDKRLVEFCLSLPPEQKINQGWTRMVMRRAMANILPMEIQWREGKSNFEPNFIRGLLTFERELLDEVILKNSEVIEEYVDMTILREVYQQFICRATSEGAITVWKAATLALWLRHAGLT